jgi:hypothetical protein
MSIKDLLRKWLFPEGVEIQPCQGCELLKEQLNAVNYERKILFEKVIEQAFPNLTASAIPDVDNLTPIRMHSKVPWRVRQQELQKNSREQARKIQAEARPDAPRVVTPESIEKLEQELGVNNAAAEEAVQENA